MHIPDEFVVIDCETRGFSSELLCVTVHPTHGEARTLWHDEHDFHEYIQTAMDSATPSFHNANFDIRVLEDNGFTVPDEFIDTMLMSYVWHPGRESHSLASWGTELGFPKMDYREECIRCGFIDKTDKKPAEFEKFNFSNKEWCTLLFKYCHNDGLVQFKLTAHLLKMFEGDPAAYKLLVDVEFPMVKAILEMERTGFYVDTQNVEAVLSELQQGTDSLLSDMRKIVGLVPGSTKKYRKPHDDDDTLMFIKEEKGTYHYKKLEQFNPSSGQQIAYAIKKLHPEWEPDKLTTAGNVKTDKEVMLSLPDTWELPSKLVEYGVLTKAQTMVQGYNERLVGNKLYGRFNQAVTLTGRLSSSDPNLQNIPARGKWGSIIRSLFVAPRGYKLVDCDLSNIEARVLAHYLVLVCGDDYLQRVFVEGTDLHQVNADTWGVSRPEAKTFLYAFLYGAGDFKLGGGDKERGKKLREKVVSKAPSLMELKEACWSAARKNDGVIHTQFGRRLVYPGINLEFGYEQARHHGLTVTEAKRYAKQLQARCERQVFNGLLQGTAADILKKITVGCHSRLEDYDTWLAASVHDELLFYAPENEVDGLVQMLLEEFSRPYLKYCPIMGEPKVGNNWGETH